MSVAAERRRATQRTQHTSCVHHRCTPQRRKRPCAAPARTHAQSPQALGWHAAPVWGSPQGDSPSFIVTTLNHAALRSRQRVPVLSALTKVIMWSRAAPLVFRRASRVAVPVKGAVRALLSPLLTACRCSAGSKCAGCPHHRSRCDFVATGVKCRCTCAQLRISSHAGGVMPTSTRRPGRSADDTHAWRRVRGRW